MKCLWHIPQRYTMKAEKPLLGEMISVFSWEEYAFFNPLISWLYKRNKACKDSHVIRLPCLKGLLFFSAAELKHFRIQENVFLSLKKKEKKWRVSFSQSLPFTNPPLGHLSTISWKKKKKIGVSSSLQPASWGSVLHNPWFMYSKLKKKARDLSNWRAAAPFCLETHRKKCSY